MNIKKYLCLTKASIMDSIQFKLVPLTTFFGNIVYLILVYHLWKAIYASSDSGVVNGMTFSDTIIYLVLATAMFNVMEMYIVWQIGRDVQSGKIVLDLLKPIKYERFLFFNYSGTMVIAFLFTFLPTFITVYVLTDGKITLGLNLIWFLISFLFSIYINYQIDFLVGTICLHTESTWGINIMKESIVLFLSGSVIPLRFFPEFWRNILQLFPFSYIYNTPLSLLLQNKPSISSVGFSLCMQLFWCMVMKIISGVFWHYSQRRITVNGG